MSLPNNTHRCNDAITNKKLKQIIEDHGVKGGDYCHMNIWKKDNKKIIGYRPSEI